MNTSHTPPGPLPEAGAKQHLEVPVIAGLLIGLTVVAWIFVTGLTGWYRSPFAPYLFGVVVGIEAAALLFMLGRTRPGRDYAQQVGQGLIASAVAAAVVFAGSVVITSVAFPTYFDDVAATRAEVMRAQGLSEAEIEAQRAALAPSQTPVGHAFAGFMGMLGSGLLVSAAAAVVLRDPQPASTSRNASAMTSGSLDVRGSTR